MKSRFKKVKSNLKDFLENFLKVIRRPDMVMLPGNIAFFLFLAIIPTLSLISYGASILNLSVDFLYDFIANSFSKDIANIVLGVHLDNQVGFQFFLTLIVGAYVASNGADSIILSSNTIYGIENKSWLKRRIKAFGLTTLLLILIIFMLVVPVFGTTITDLIKEVNLNPQITTRIVATFDLLKGPITWLIMFAIIKVIYVVAPDKKRGNRVINYGALFTTIGWILMTKVYSIYVTSYARYNTLYGGLAGIVVLVIWLYLLSYIFTIGMALNYEKDETNLSKTGTIKTEN